MKENEQENIDSKNDAGSVAEIADDNTSIDTKDTVEAGSDDVDGLKKQIETLKAQKDHWKSKATKSPDTKTKAEPKQELSTSDIYSLMRANVPEDDIAEVSEYARFKGISVTEALNSSVIKSTLAERAEKRNAAQATSTGAARRGTARVSDEQLMEKASKGILPDSDEDLVRLIKIQKGIK